MAAPKVIIRADGNSTIGLGHVMRMSALASAIDAAGAQVSLAYKTCPPQILERFAKSNCRAARIEESASLEQELSILADAQKIVLDGYHFDAAYQDKLLAQTNARLLIVDDTAHLDLYKCDLLLNQNAFISESVYSGKTSAKLLLGHKFVLLRDEFRKIEPKGRKGEPGQKLLISMGGSDSENVTAKVIEAAATTKYEFAVILGSASPNRQLVEAQLRNTPKGRLIVSPENMASIFAEHDLLVSAGGTTVWEAAYLGLPNIVIITADNQSGMERFAERGACINLGPHKDVTVEQISQNINHLFEDVAKRQTLANIATSLVDGLGASRVAAALLELNGP